VCGPHGGASRPGTVIAMAAVLVLVLGLALSGCGGDDEAGTTTTTASETQTQPPPPPPQPPPPPPAPPKPTMVRVNVRGGVPAGGIVRVSTDKGDRVVVLVRSDVADHVHVHVYDLFRDVGPGSPARIPFRATIPGRIEIELEDRHVPIAQLTVTP
jgi:hypothetical protein